jgi:hypothetical protein
MPVSTGPARIDEQSTREKLPKLIADRYRVTEELKRGGMGEILVAVDETSGKRVALKRLLDTQTGKIPAMLFEREYHTLASIKHPCIVEVYDYGIDRVPFFTMELLDGRDLRELAPLSYREACRYLRDVASSLALLHARHLLHRDVTPANVRITAEGRCKLLDFGALTSFGLPEQVIGTPPSTAPEALYGIPLDQRLDLYALGALGYWLLAGRHAYPTRELADLPELWARPLLPPSTFVKSIPEELDQLILSLLSQDRVERPATAAEVMDRLSAIAGLEPLDQGEVADSYLAVPRLIGRSRELESIKRSIAGAAQGEGGSAYVEAIGGMGKTRLIDDATLIGRIAGITVVRVDAELHRNPFGIPIAVAEALVQIAPSSARRAAESDIAVLAQLVPALAHGEANGGEVAQYPGERRAQIQGAFQRWLATFAAERPLAILCDNLHAADQASLGFLLGVARQAMSTKLWLLSTTQVGEAVADIDALRRLKEISQQIELLPLKPDETRAFAEALFGDVPNVNRFADWLHVTSAGNPLQALELSRYAVAKRLARYTDGLWVLPSDLARAAAPLGAELTEWTLRQLSLEAYRVAETLSIHDGPLTLELCAMLASSVIEGKPIFSILDELVSHGVLMSHASGFRFARGSTRSALVAGLNPEHKKQLHRLVAEALLATKRDDFRTIVGAGWHLIHAGEQTRGADLLAGRLARVASNARTLAVDDDLHAAVPGLEAAYRVYREQNRSAYELAPLLVTLVGASYYVDWRLAERYGDEALDVLSRALGLTLAARLRPFIGGRLSLVVGVLWARVRFGFASKRQGAFRDLFVALLGCVTYLVAISLIRLEADVARRYAGVLAPFRALGERLAPAGIAEYCENLALFADNRLAASRSGFLKLLARLQDEKHYYRSLNSEGRKLFLGGALYALGILEAFRDTGDVLHYAGELEAQRFRFYDIVASRLRIAHHAYRGEMERIPPFRERLDLHAIQYGSAWQVELWSPAAMISAYVNTGDISGLKRVTDELNELSNEIPRMRTLAQVAESTHAFLRGDIDHGISLLEQLQSAGQLSGYPGCTRALGWLAAMYNQSGRYEQAKTLCKGVLARTDPEDRDFVVFNLKLEIELALAEAALGETKQASQSIEKLFEKFGHSRGPVTLAMLHQARARIALLCGDEKIFVQHLQAMRDLAHTTGNGALIAQWKRLERKAQRRSEGPADPSTVLEHTAVGNTELDASIPRASERRVSLPAGGPESDRTQTLAADIALRRPTG